VRRACAVLLCLAALLCPAACAPAHTDAGLPGELRICSTGDYRPFTYRDPDGRWSGIDVDMARAFATSLRLRPALVATTWHSLLADLAARCDLAVGGISVTPERTAAALVSTAFLTDGKTPITRCADVARYDTLADINRPGVRVVVNPGGTNERFAERAFRRATLLRWPDNNTIVDRIAAGDADVMVTDATEARWQARRHPGLCAVHPDRPFTAETKAYLLPAGATALRDRLDAWLAAALHDGAFARFARPWWG
jgi:cyclohexadienyl dehydratase